jgi:multidrug resistance efflux pump
MDAKFVKRILIIAAGLALVIIAASGAFRGENNEAGLVEVRREAVQIWSTYEGYLESRTVGNIMPRIGGSATVIELAPEGSIVKPGDVLVRFDSSQFDREVMRLERDYMTARSDLEGLTNAKLPLELHDLEMRMLQAQSDYSTEAKYLRDTRDLLKDGLVAEVEVQQQELKVESLKAQADNLAEQLSLTRQFLHPSTVERAQTLLAAAEQEYMAAQRQVENCTILAPMSGVVIYKPLAVGGEYRTARVGDTLFKNQPFMALPDMSNLVAHLDVPESELAYVRAGQAVSIQPRAYPGASFNGVVESVGSMAQSRMDRPAWQKYFHVIVALRDGGDELRSGMSALCKVLTHDETNALVVPRGAVKWDGAEPYCLVARRSHRDKKFVKLGPADEQRFIVRDGVQAGDRVMVE